MKKIIIIGLIFLTTLSYSQNELNENKYYAKTETVFIKSKIYNKERELQIFLPDEYFKNSKKNFKVFYLFDAQNQRIFNFVSGNIQLLSMNEIEPVIIVGVVTEDRWDEFLTPNNHKETLERYQPPMGSADKLLNHIEKEIEPYLKTNYRTQNYRLAAGHSLGATFLTYATIKTDLFDYSILMSPNYQYDKEQFIDRFKDFVKTDLDKEKKLFFTNGLKDMYEERFNPSLKKVIKILKENPNSMIKWKHESLKIEKHGLIWMEGIYKGLLNWK